MSGIRQKSSTTKQDERNREHATTLSRTYAVPTTKYGTVVALHNTAYACTIQLPDGSMAANGAYIPITNPWNTFIMEFGNLRPGLLCQIDYTGEMDIQPYATIIALEGESLAAPVQPPVVNTSLYAVFTPGQ